MIGGIGAIFLAVLAITQPGRLPDPNVPAELEAVAQHMADKLPMRQETPQGVIVFESMQARGYELITTMTVPSDGDAAQVAQDFQERLPDEACSNPVMRGIIDRGATVTYIVQVDEKRFTASVNVC